MIDIDDESYLCEIEKGTSKVLNLHCDRYLITIQNTETLDSLRKVNAQNKMKSVMTLDVHIIKNIKIELLNISSLHQYKSLMPYASAIPLLSHFSEQLQASN